MSTLWLPDSASEFLVVTVDSEAGETDWEGMFLLNQAATDWLAGKLDTGTYFDMFEHFGINPLEFVKPVEEYVLNQVKSPELV